MWNSSFFLIHKSAMIYCRAISGFDMRANFILIKLVNEQQLRLYSYMMIDYSEIIHLLKCFQLLGHNVFKLYAKLCIKWSKRQMKIFRVFWQVWKRKREMYTLDFFNANTLTMLRPSSAMYFYIIFFFIYITPHYDEHQHIYWSCRHTTPIRMYSLLLLLLHLCVAAHLKVNATVQ